MKNKSPPMITRHNYHVASKGTFNVVSTAKIKRLWASLESQGFKPWTAKKGDSYVFEGKTYEFDYYSTSNRYVSVSIYFIVDGRQILRISDHWSDGCTKLITKKVGHIRSCFWALQGNSFPFWLDIGNTINRRITEYSFWGNPYTAYKTECVTNCLLAGIININELKQSK